MSHMPFVIGAYAVFFVVLLADAIAPQLARRALLRRLRARFVREQRREAA